MSEMKYAVWIMNLSAVNPKPRIALDEDLRKLVSCDKDLLEQVAEKMKRKGYSVWVAEIMP